MTAAAIQASYADYRRVKGRKVLQLIFEVPLEMAPQVHEAFGEPLPDGSTWVGVARIDTTAAPERKGGKLCQRAAILCNEGAFKNFIADYMLLGVHPDAIDPVYVLRNHCGINTRAELDHNTEAANKFLELERTYKAWLTQ